MVRKQRTALAVMVALVALGMTGAVAQDEDGTIQACARKSDGALRIAKKCSTNERTVRWNIQGTAGADGQNGQDGADGLDGSMRTIRTYNFTLPDVTITAERPVEFEVARLTPAEIGTGNFLLRATIRGSFTGNDDWDALYCFWATDSEVDAGMVRAGGDFVHGGGWNGVVAQPTATLDQLSSFAPISLYCDVWTSMTKLRAYLVVDKVGSILSSSTRPQDTATATPTPSASAAALGPAASPWVEARPQLRPLLG